LLHLGSLYTALASYLDARKHNGQWLLRIDDLDTPRNQPGAISAIIDCLQNFGLIWNGEVYYQSQHNVAYEKAIALLRDKLYACACSRKQLGQQIELYPGHCRHKHLAAENNALRIKSQNENINFIDRAQGWICENMAARHGDFVIKRKDSIIAYQLAVVVDDHEQQINHVVRGFDLLESTTKQIFLQQLLNFPTPEYMHVPIIVDSQGHKLSKQTLAHPVDKSQASATLFLLLNLLQQNPPANLRNAAIPDILEWAIAHWKPQHLFNTRTIKSSHSQNF
jgi:glutamyl-Q tRNA(Asp) synthetase